MSASDEDKSSTAVQKAYGRGFHDALRSVGAGIGDMKQSKLDETYRSLNGVAKKVLDVVPIQEQWPITKIISEIARLGSRPDHKVVRGCLKSLADQGLIKRCGPQGAETFIKVVGSQESAKKVDIRVPDESKSQIIEMPMKADNKDTLGKLAALSADARLISDRLLSLARSIDDLAIEVEERIQSATQGSEKLRQLQDLLRSI